MGQSLSWSNHKRRNIESLLGADDEELAKGNNERFIDSLLALLTFVSIFAGIFIFGVQFVVWLLTGEWDKWSAGNGLHLIGFDPNQITTPQSPVGWQKAISAILNLPLSNFLFVIMPMLVFVLEVLKPEIDYCVDGFFKFKMFIERSYVRSKRFIERRWGNVNVFFNAIGHYVSLQ
jgi:hypothetical protein